MSEPTPPQPGASGKPDRFDSFSQRAKQVLALAQEESQRFNHNYIGTEHLLLGLVREGEGVAAKVLSNLGVDLTKVRSATEFIIGRGNRAPIGEIGLTPRARTVIELAVDEAHRLGHHFVGTEHLLLGLVREGEGIAAGVLESLGVDLEKVRQQTITVLSRSTARAVQDGEVVSCRVDAGDLRLIDTLVAAGVRSTRGDVLSWLVHVGLEAQREFITKLAPPGQSEGQAPQEPRSDVSEP